MPVPSHEHATALMTEYTYHGQENRLDTYGLEPPGPYEILLKASLQVCTTAETGLSRVPCLVPAVCRTSKESECFSSHHIDRWDLFA
jgi:hypothetical protein